MVLPANLKFFILSPCTVHELTMIRRPGEVYDVAFILPWLAKFLDVAAPFDSKKFVDCGALSLTLIAFSSQDESVRKLAYHITAVLTDALSVRFIYIFF